MSRNPAIEIRNLTVRHKERPAPHDFSMHLAPGEKALLMGPSGAGKTTVLRALLGFARPEAGRIEIEGQALSPTTVWALRRRIAWVPQEPELGDGPVRETLHRPFQYQANHHLRGNLERAPDLFKRFLLDSVLLDQNTNELSGGEKQRVALVSALLLERPILLLDEATSALDPEARAAVAEYVEAAGELTVLAVSHDPDHLGFIQRTVALAPPRNGSAEASASPASPAESAS